MFAPLAPIQPDARRDSAVDSLLARVDAIQTVLTILGRMAGRAPVAALSDLDDRANLAVQLAEQEAGKLAYLATELDAVAAALQAGFAAIESARKQGRRGEAAAAFLQREANSAFAAIIAMAAGRAAHA